MEAFATQVTHRSRAEREEEHLAQEVLWVNCLQTGQVPRETHLLRKNTSGGLVSTLALTCFRSSGLTFVKLCFL